MLANTDIFSIYSKHNSNFTFWNSDFIKYMDINPLLASLACTVKLQLPQRRV